MTLPEFDSVTILEKIRSLNENDFTHNFVIPMLEQLGYFGVTYTHGIGEHGRDVTFYSFDLMSHREDGAALVKVADIRGNSSISEVIGEARAAYENPFLDNYTHEERKICVLHVITSGKIPEYSRVEIHNALKNYPRIHFMEGEEVIENLRRTISNFLEFSKIEPMMNEISFISLLTDRAFLSQAEELIVFLMKDESTSPLGCVSTLPSMLTALPSIKDKIESLDEFRRKSILHWFSIGLIIKAWFVYGKSSKFGLLDEKITEVV